MTDLNYHQRKALRRLGRGQSISGRMLTDPLISQCFEWSESTEPPADMDIIEWCDWEARLRSVYPVLNGFGKELLAQLP